MRFWLILLLFPTGNILNAQRNHFNLIIGFGPGYTFNDKTLSHALNNCILIGTNYTLSDKSRRIQFNPGIHYQGNHYHASLGNYRQVHVNQNVFNLTFDMLMKIASKKYLRVGLFFNRLDYSSLFISETELTGRSYYHNNTPEIRKDYLASIYQAGITAGVCYTFSLLDQEQRVNIKLMQVASPVVASSGYDVGAKVAGKDVSVLSPKARPSILILAYECSLQRVKKEKRKDPEEEE